MNLFQKIKQILDSNNVDYQIIEHQPTPTSEESAKARGEEMKTGAKAILMKANDYFMLAVLPADKKIDGKKLRKILKVKKLRFANQEELYEITNCKKGAVPPFGDLLNVNMIIDKLLFTNKFMAFNAGSLTKSIKMQTKDYFEIVKPKLGDFHG